MINKLKPVTFKDYMGITGVFRSEDLFNVKAKFYNVEAFINEYVKESLPDISLN